MAGGPSHLETFDPKPLLNELNGQPRPKEFGEVKRQFIKGEPKLLGSKRTFKQHGNSGLWVSDLLPHIATCADDLAVIRSCQADAFVHSAAQYQLLDRKSTRLNSSHSQISYAVFCLKKKKQNVRSRMLGTVGDRFNASNVFLV